jgi:hypothetical protein
MSVFSTKNIRSMLRAMLPGYCQFSLQSAGAYQNSKNFPGSSVMGKCAEFSNHTHVRKRESPTKPLFRL